MSFEAKYYGTCASEDCTTQRISPGQQIEYDDNGETVHTTCAKAERGEPLGPYCNLCHTYHRGECW